MATDLTETETTGTARAATDLTETETTGTARAATDLTETEITETVRAATDLTETEITETARAATDLTETEITETARAVTDLPSAIATTGTVPEETADSANPARAAARALLPKQPPRMRRSTEMKKSAVSARRRINVPARTSCMKKRSR